MMSQEGFVTTD